MPFVARALEMGPSHAGLCKCELIYAAEKDALHTRRGMVTTERRREIVRVLIASHGWNRL